MSYDPFQILQVSYTADLDTIREAFKSQALIHHPDRGGNPYHFDLCKRAYNDIYKYKKEQMRQLHMENRNISHLQQERSSSFGPSLNKVQQKQLQRNFNQIFQNIRVETPNDIGYGDMMERSTKSREDNPKLSAAKKFKQNQVVVFEEPQPLPTINENYEVLGQDKVNDFSNHSKGYTDYMVAHSEQEMTDKPHERIAKLDNVKNRPSFKSIDQLQSARSNISYQMSPEEEMRYKNKLRQEQELEEQRKMMFFQHKQDVEKRFNQIHNYLSY